MNVSFPKCSGCGVCVALCPRKALVLKVSALGHLRPSLDKAYCSSCGLCRIVCPFEDLKSNACEEEMPTSSVVRCSLTSLIGRYLRVGLTWSTDTNIRYNSASGGTVTSILKCLLEEGFVDAVLIPRVLVRHGRVLGRYEIVRDSKRVIEYSGSIYAPTYISEALNIAIREKLQVALVGLPCQIRALRRASKLLPVLRDNLRVILGLFCNNMPSSRALEYAVKTLLKVSPKEVRHISFRGSGWPGYTTVVTTTGKTLRVPFFRFWDTGFGQYFYAEQCFLCNDHTAELADISFADPWTYQKDIGIGKTITVIRTKTGLEILEGAVKSGYLEFKDLPILYVVQYATLLKKAVKVTVKRSNYFVYTLPPSITSILHELDYWLGSKLAGDERLWSLLRIYVRVKPYLLSPLITFDHSLKLGFIRVLTKFSKAWLSTMPSVNYTVLSDAI